MIKIGIFAFLTILLFAFTLSRPHRHRFYRFLAFESLLALIIRNADSWFRDPFSFIHIISWVLLIGSLLLAIHGFRLLHVAGSPKGDFEDTTQLITTGAYQYIRHPLYCSLLLLGVGVFLKRPTLLDCSLLIILFISVYATAKVEERDNIIKFGPAYRAYIEKTRMFVPFPFRSRPKQEDELNSSDQTTRVLFLCTHNSARSQMAEGLLRHMSKFKVEVRSAGTVATYVRPEAISVMEEMGIDISQQYSKVLDPFIHERFDFVITVCDSANESCPIFPNARNRWHWSIDNPSSVEGSETERMYAFRKARDELKDRIQTQLLPVLAGTTTDRP